MELTNDFRVGVTVPEAWKVLTDVERIAPLLPGAQLQEVEGDEYRGVVKVKVGPITAQYKGTATFVEQDEAAGKVVIRASGRDTRGQGNASATITATMTADGDATKVSVVTDLTITGKVAQFGRGVLADVSAKLLGQFVDALEQDLASSGSPGGSQPDAPAPPAEGASVGSSGDPLPAAGSATSATTPAAAAGTTAAAGGTATGSDSAPPAANGTRPAGPRRIESAEAEPLDLLAIAGGSTAKRLVPVAAALAALVLALLVRRRLSR